MDVSEDLPFQKNASDSIHPYREHPDWCLHLPGRAMSEGRNQLVLDLTRHEVRACDAARAFALRR